MLKTKYFAWILGLPIMGLKAQDKGLGTFMKFNDGKAFTCITVDAENNIWAGTNKQGLYKLTQLAGLPIGNFNTVSIFEAPLALPVIQSLAADDLGNVWVGHAGNGGGPAAGGGLEQVNAASGSLIKHYSPDRNTKGMPFFERDGLATLNVKSITVDANNTVWTAHRYHDLTSEATYIVTPGGMSVKGAGNEKFITYSGYYDRAAYPEWPFPAYTYKTPITVTAQTRTCNAIGSNDKQVWISVYGYLAEDEMTQIPPHIKVYDLNGVYQGGFTYASIAGSNAVGVFNGIHLTDDGDAWVTMSAGTGFAVMSKGAWKVIRPGDLPCVFPAGTIINENAIWGNAHGNVFIGTNKGLLAYNGRGSVDSAKSYTWYRSSVHTDMISDNITGGCSEKDSIQWMATSSGIMRLVVGRYPTKHTQEYSVILGRKVPKAFGYQTCNNPTMNYVENALKAPNVKLDKSYHYYTIETEICRQDGTNGKYCTAENIYKMMLDDVTFAAVTPYDFPQDDFTMPFLKGLTKADLATIEKAVNSFSPRQVSPSATHGSIANFTDVVTDPRLKELLDDQEVGEFIGKSIFSLRRLTPREIVLKRHMTENPSKVISCNQIYKLFNSPNFVQARVPFSLGNRLPAFILGCDSTGYVEPYYDPVFIYTNTSEFTNVNYTMKGHMLYPGKITRKVVEDCGKVKMITVGEGLHFCGNNTMGMANGNGNTVGGLILFKNVDFRLIEAFKKLK